MFVISLNTPFALLKNVWLLLGLASATSSLDAQKLKPFVTLYPGTTYIQEIYYAKETRPEIKEGDYYSFYNGYLENVKWSGNKIDEDHQKGVKTRGYFKDNLKDSVWTIYFPPAKDAKVNAIREEGWYLNDKKAGIWYTFFEEGKVQKRYDFDEQRELSPIIRAKFIYPEKARTAKAEGLVSVKIIIRNCVVHHYEIMKDIGYGCGDSMIRALKNAEKLRTKYGMNAVDCTRKDSVVTTRFKISD